MAVLIVGTLDTKGQEIGFARDLLRAQGFDVLVVDAGILGAPRLSADIPREALFAEANLSLDAVREAGDRGRAVEAAGIAAAALVARLHAEGRVDGVLALGGSAGTVIGTAVMRALPFGLPKVMLSTLASGQTRPYVGGSDLAMFHSVADLAGENRLTRTVIGNAANALAGMVRGRSTEQDDPTDDRPVVAATMFGVTTPCVDRARSRLESAGCEVIVFHATGIGGMSMEALIRDGRVDAVLDITTTELADEAVGGVLSAGPDRLHAAARAGIPQVVSVGAVDMVNFGPIDTVPERFRDRRFHVHNSTVTLMRTTPEENRSIARAMARAFKTARAPVELVLPLRGVSAIDLPGKPFHDPQADAALFETLRTELAGCGHVTIHELDHAINDPEFADFAAERLRELLPADRLRH